ATVAVESQAEPVAVVDREAAWALQDQDTAEWEVVNETRAAEMVERAAVKEAAPTPEMVALEAPMAAEKLAQPEVAQEVSAHVEVEPPTAPAPLLGQITLDQLSPEVIDAIA